MLTVLISQIYFEVCGQFVTSKEGPDTDILHVVEFVSGFESDDGCCIDTVAVDE